MRTIRDWCYNLCALRLVRCKTIDLFYCIIGISEILPCNRNLICNRNLTLQTREFFRLHSTFARLYNAATSPASRLCSAGSLAIIIFNNLKENRLNLLSLVDWYIYIKENLFFDSVKVSARLTFQALIPVGSTVGFLLSIQQLFHEPALDMKW